MTIIWTTASGLFILWSYYLIFYCRIYTGTGHSADRWLWAGIGQNTLTFCTWCVLASAATVSYIALFIMVVCMGSWSDSVHVFVVANSLFLLFSALYPWLVFRVFKLAEVKGSSVVVSKCYVLISLLCVALSAGGMAYSFWPGGSEVSPEFVFALLLAIHCFFMDCVVWGITWFRQATDNIHHNEKNDSLILNSELVFTSPGSFSNVQINFAEIKA
jgi:hypothetical protein